MKNVVYVLVDSCSNDVVSVAWSAHGAVKIAIAENRDLVFDDGLPITPEQLDKRLAASATVHFYVPGSEFAVGNIQRWRVEA